MIFADDRSFLFTPEAMEVDLLGVGGCNLATFEAPFNCAGATAAAAADAVVDVGATASFRDFSNHDVVFANNKCTTLTDKVFKQLRCRCYS